MNIQCKKKNTFCKIIKLLVKMGKNPDTKNTIFTNTNNTIKILKVSFKILKFTYNKIAKIVFKKRFLQFMHLSACSPLYPTPAQFSQSIFVGRYY